MFKLKTHKLLIALIFICTYSVVFSAEPNEAKTELKFEINKIKAQPWISGTMPGRGPIKPTHEAVFYIRRPNLSESFSMRNEGISQILNTSAGKTFSEKQRNFLSASDAMIRLGEQDIRNHDKIVLYGVSEEETKKTVRAYFEVANNKTNEHIQIFEKMRNTAKEKINKIKKKVPEKQKQLKEAEKKYQKFKDARYFLFDEGPAYDKARETIMKIGNTLDILEIELAGIQEKLNVIESYRNTKRLPRKALSDESIDKLDQMYVEQIVELRGIEARKKAALQICDRAKEFLNLYNQRNNLKSEAHSLQRDLKFSENNLREAERMLFNPPPEMQPPKLYLDKVTIYPVE
jgi:hypothetical protein